MATPEERRDASDIRRTVTAAEPASARAPAARMTIATTTSISVNPRCDPLLMDGRYFLHRRSRHRPAHGVIEKTPPVSVQSVASVPQKTERRPSGRPFPPRGETAHVREIPWAAHSPQDCVI